MDVETDRQHAGRGPTTKMAGRPTTSASPRPYTANSDPRPLTGWSESEAPSTSHGPTKNAYPAPNYQHQHQETQAQHLSHQHGLYVQQEESKNDNDDGRSDSDEFDDGDVFAYGPPLTSEHPPQPHQVHYSQHEHQHQQDLSQHQHLSAAQLHNLVAATGEVDDLFTSTSAPPPPPPPGLSSIPGSPRAPNSHSSRAHDHHNHPPATTSSYEYWPGQNSNSMRPIPVSSGILDPQHPKPTLEPISYAYPPARESL
jgi:hypothetical protein